MSDLGWKEAIVEVLQTENEPMHYADIAQAIADQELKTKFGATPAASVSATISISLRDEGDDSPFIKVARGLYTLKTTKLNISAESISQEDTEIEKEAGLINAFGMFWKRDNVLWTTNPKLLGQQQTESEPVDFCEQKGVYLLHDGSKVVYAGRTTNQTLGIRLKQHTTDRLNGRWDRFSWFGVYEVQEDGTLSATLPAHFGCESLIATMEALLIEGLEPTQNRRRGDDFSAVEFIQVKDPQIQRDETIELFEKVKNTWLGR